MIQMITKKGRALDDPVNVKVGGDDWKRKGWVMSGMGWWWLDTEESVSLSEKEEAAGADAQMMPLWHNNQKQPQQQQQTRQSTGRRKDRMEEEAVGSQTHTTQGMVEESRKAVLVKNETHKQLQTRNDNFCCSDGECVRDGDESR